MIRVILMFLLLSGLVWLGILGIQKITGTQALNLTKSAVYAIVSSSVALALMFILVEIF